MLFKIAFLPVWTVTIQIAPSLKNIAAFAENIAFFPGVTIGILKAIAWSGFALVVVRIAVFECRIALAIRITVAWGGPAYVVYIADLPRLTVSV